MGTSHKILIGLNSLFFILGAAMFAGGIYLQVEGAKYAGLYDSTAVWMLGGAGLGILLVSLMGCYGANERKAFYLGCYALLLFLLIVVQAVGAYFMFTYIGTIQAIDSGAVSSAISDVLAQQINNGVLSSYTKCCSGCSTAGACTREAAVEAIGNSTANCPASACTAVEACPETNPPAACFVFLDGDTVETPPFILDTAVCTALQTITYNETLLVGPAADGSCGGGVPKNYQNAVNGWAASQFGWFVVAGAVLAALQLLLLGAAMVAICKGRDG